MRAQNPGLPEWVRGLTASARVAPPGHPGPAPPVHTWDSGELAFIEDAQQLQTFAFLCRRQTGRERAPNLLETHQRLDFRCVPHVLERQRDYAADPDARAALRTEASNTCQASLHFGGKLSNAQADTSLSTERGPVSKTRQAGSNEAQKKLRTRFDVCTRVDSGNTLFGYNLATFGEYPLKKILLKSTLNFSEIDRRDGN